MTLQTPLSRKRFLQGSAAVGGSVAIGGPLAALAARSAEGHPAPRAPGYGPIAPTPAEGSTIAYIALPAGFKYRVISKQLDPSIAFVTDPATGEAVRTTVPTPGVFDGMGAFRGPRGTTILIRNHEYRQQPEPGVVVPLGDRYDANPRFNAGNTKVVVGRDRTVVETIHVLGGTSTNCAGGETPWNTWITCEEVFIAQSATDLKHGYCFEIDAHADEPNPAVPMKAAGCFAHEAVAWLKGILYETEDSGNDSGFYRWIPDRKPREFGDLASTGGPLQAIKRKGSAAPFDANTAVVGETFEVEWVTIPNPDPPTNTVKTQGTARGKIQFRRLEGCWVGEGKIYFDSTSGGPAGKGQIWEYDPDHETLKLIFQSPGAAVLEAPDNLVYVPHTGDIFLQEDGPDDQFVRGVTQDGEIYDFAQTIVNDSEFCGGCFSPDGRTFFLNQQGGTGITNPADVDANGGLTYAIWGPFGGKGNRNGHKNGHEHGDD